MPKKTIQVGPYAPDLVDWNTEVSLVVDGAIRSANGFRSIPNQGPPTPSQAVTATGFGVLSPRNWYSVQAHRFFNYSERAPEGEWMSLISTTNQETTPELYAASRLHATSVEFMQASIGCPLVVNNDHWAQTRNVFVDWDDEVLIFGNFDPQKITHANISQALDDSGTTKTSDLGGTPPGARFAAKVGQQLVLGYVAESGVSYPRRLWWSAFGNHEGWTAGTNLAGFEDAALAEGGDITGVVGGEYGLVFQQNQVTRIDFIGAPDVWQFSKIAEGQGSHVPGSIVKAGNDVYYYSPSGWRVIRDGTTSEPVGAESIDEWYKGIEEDAGGGDEYYNVVRWMSGAYDQVSGCIYWTYGEYTGGESGVSTNLLVLNPNAPPGTGWSTITEDVISLFQLEPQGREFAVGMIVPSSSTIPGANPTEVHISDFLNASGAAMYPLTIETGRLFEDQDQKMYVRGVRVNIDGAYQVAIIEQQDDSYDSEVTGSPVSPNDYGWCEFDTEARYIRVKITTSGTWEKIMSFQLDYEPAGEY